MSEEEKNKLSDKEKEIIESYRNLVKETGVDTGWVICNPAIMWSEYFISKDKIKEKYLEMEKEYAKKVYDNKYDRTEVKKEEMYKRQVYEELLEEK